MNSLLLTERDNMQYDRTLDGRNSAKSVVLKEKKEINITANFKNGPPQVQTRGGGVGGGGGEGKSIHPMSHKQRVPPIIILVYYPFFTSHI